MATFTKLKSGSWRVQVRRKGKYVNETFLRRKDAEEWALDVERRVDRGDPALVRSSREARTFGNLISLHCEDLKEVGKPIGRSKAASLNLLQKRLGRLRLPELDRARIIQFGKERAREGAGPVTLGIDLGYIKTILSHAAAVHGVTLSTEPIALARVALARLGLVGKGNERDRRPTQDELDRLVAGFEANRLQQIPVGRIVRFASDPSAVIPPSGQPWNGTRVLYLMHPSDPIVWWSPHLIFSEPDWISEPPGQDVLKGMFWMPFVTFWQVTADLPFATGVPGGHGHTYTSEYVDGFNAVMQPAGITSEDLASLRKMIAGD